MEVGLPRVIGLDPRVFKSQAVVRDAVLEGIQTWCLGLKCRDVGNFFPNKNWMGGIVVLVGGKVG